MKIIKLLSIAFLFGTFLISCEGPEGPPGEDGSAVCNACHNEGTAFTAKQSQFSASAHSLGTYYTREGQCAGCHSTEGFLARMDFTSISEIDSLGQDNQTPISCRTCHNVHMDYAETDYSLTFADQVTETIFGYTSPEHASSSFGDYGDGNMCLQCHQARDQGNVPSVTSTDSVKTSSRWGPHYGVQGNVLLAQGGVHIVGDSYPGTTAGHAGLSNACITCHMHEGDHTLAVNYDACATCHTSADNAEDLVADLEDEIHDLLFELGAALTAKGLMSETLEDGELVGYAPKRTTVHADDARAVYNYMVVYQDHSYGVHNPSYIRALLNNSIETLK